MNPVAQIPWATSTAQKNQVPKLHFTLNCYAKVKQRYLWDTFFSSDNTLLYYVYFVIIQNTNPSPIKDDEMKDMIWPSSHHIIHTIQNADDHTHVSKTHVIREYVFSKKPNTFVKKNPLAEGLIWSAQSTSSKQVAFKPNISKSLNITLFLILIENMHHR